MFPFANLIVLSLKIECAFETCFTGLSFHYPPDIFPLLFFSLNPCSHQLCGSQRGHLCFVTGVPASQRSGLDCLCALAQQLGGRTEGLLDFSWNHEKKNLKFWSFLKEAAWVLTGAFCSPNAKNDYFRVADFKGVSSFVFTRLSSVLLSIIFNLQKHI